MHRGLSVAGSFAALLLAGCFAIGDSTAPIATESVAATRPSGEHILVIVLSAARRRLRNAPMQARNS